MSQALYIGEENLIVKALKSKMDEKGHELKIINNPVDALADLFRVKYDLIITNLLNDELDGIQIFNTLSGSNTLNSISQFALITAGENVDKLFAQGNRPQHIFKKDANVVNNLIDILNGLDKDENITALYVEDDVFVRKLVMMWLKKFPHVYIDMVASISEIKDYTNNEYDIIVTDNLLGDGTAKDVIEFIQNTNSLKNTPILIYTGTVENLSLKELQKLGNVIDVLPKPFEMKTFIQKLQMVKKLKS